MTGSKAKGANEPSVIASSLDHAERLGVEAGDIDDHVKQMSFTLFAGTKFRYQNTAFINI
jgi:hypothetical protein